MAIPIIVTIIITPEAGVTPPSAIGCEIVLARVHTLRTANCQPGVKKYRNINHLFGCSTQFTMAELVKAARLGVSLSEGDHYLIT